MWGYGDDVLLVFSFPFAALVLCIAIFPLLPPKFGDWWDKNRNKLLVGLVLSGIVLGYYGHAGGWSAVAKIIHESVFLDYIPFIVLLFCLYTVAGGIRVIEDIPAHALTNTIIL